MAPPVKSCAAAAFAYSRARLLSRRADGGTVAVALFEHVATHTHGRRFVEAEGSVGLRFGSLVSVSPRGPRGRAVKSARMKCEMS